jgi:hypothetical protein
MAQRYDITDGPSKWELMLSLFDENRNIIPVLFRVLKVFDNRIYVVITDIGKGQPIGVDFHFKGHLQGYDTAVRGRFSTQSRDGWIEVQE